MSRHRNVRSLNFQDECEGYDDVYGHSVEDDYCVSPGTVAQFTYDRNRHDPLATYMSPPNDPIEEKDEDEDDEGLEDDHHNASNNSSRLRQALNDLDNAKLNSCLEVMQNIMGDYSESIMIEAAIKSNFDPNVATNLVMDQQDAPKPQRKQRERDRDSRFQQTLPTTENICCAPQVIIQPSVVTAGSSRKLAPESAQKIVPKETTQKNIRKEPVGDSSSRKKDSTCDSSESNINGSNIVQKDDRSTYNEFADFGAEGPSTVFSTPKRELLSDFSAATPMGMHKSASKAKMDRLDPQKEYERRKEGGKENLNVVVVGHVDAGKSTLMGHVLYQLGFVNKKTMHKYEQESKKIGKGSFAFAWVLDETEEERSRGVTMDIAQTKFETKSKIITLLDAPGHKDFIPNMITGAATADVAILVVNATKGEFETGFETGGQTREHAMLVRSLGVSQLIVAVNKMDTIDWSQERYQEIVKKLTQFLKQAGFKEEDVSYIPCSGLAGENLTKRSTESRLTWYKGPTMVDQIDQFRSPVRPIIDKPFRLCISDVFKGMGAGFAISGTIQAGSVQVGDRMLVIPAGEIAYAKGIVIDESPVGIAFAGDNVVITLTGIDMINVTMGSIVCDPTNAIEPTNQFRARIVIFNIDLPITKGYPVVLHYQSLTEQAHITRLISQLHRNTGEVIKKNPRCLVKNTSAFVEIQVDRPVCLELYRDFKELGRFMLRSGGSTIAAGLVTEIVKNKSLNVNGNECN